MEHIICPDLAPVQIHSLLEDLNSKPDVMEYLIEMIIDHTSIESFKYGSDIIPGHQGCTAMCILIQSFVLPDNQREDFLREEEPHHDFDEEDLVSWDGLCLAIQFASKSLLKKIALALPREYVLYAIAELPEPEMKDVATAALAPTH